MTTIEQCEHCGAEGPVLPTPEGDHCEACYETLMGQALEDMRSRQCGNDPDDE